MPSGLVKKQIKQISMTLLHTNFIEYIHVHKWTCYCQDYKHRVINILHTSIQYKMLFKFKVLHLSYLNSTKCFPLICFHRLIGFVYVFHTFLIQESSQTNEYFATNYAHNLGMEIE